MKTDFRKHDDISEQVNILKIINRYGKITRRQIVELTGFSQAKISILINVLRKSNLIDEVNEVESSGGRKAKLLQIRGEKGRIVGLEIGGYEVKLSLVDYGGSLLATAKRPAPQEVGDPAKVVESLAAFIQESLRANGVDRAIRHREQEHRRVHVFQEPEVVGKSPPAVDDGGCMRPSLHP